MIDNFIRLTSMLSDIVYRNINLCEDINLSDKETIDEFSKLISNQSKINNQIYKLMDKLTDQFIDEELTKLAEEFPSMEFRHQKDFDHEGQIERIIYFPPVPSDFKSLDYYFIMQGEIEDKLEELNYLNGNILITTDESFYEEGKYKIYKFK